MLKYIKKEIENLTEEAEFFKKINDLTNNVPGANSRIETIKLFFKKLVDNDAAKLLNPSDISDDLDTELGGKTDSIEVKKQNIAIEFGLESNSENVAFIQNIIALWETLKNYTSIDLFKKYLTLIINQEIITKSNDFFGVINIDDLPVMEMFFKQKPMTEIRMRSISQMNLEFYGKFDLFHSVFTKEQQSFSTVSKKEDLLSWFISPNLSCAVQETEKSFTYISDVTVNFDADQIKVNPNENKFYFKTDNLISEIKLNEDYSIVVNKLVNEAEDFFQNQQYIESLEIEPILYRLSSAVELSHQTISEKQVLRKGITYKLVIDIDNNIVAYLSCLDLMQSLKYLKYNGKQTIDVGFSKDRLFIRSKNANNINNYAIIEQEEVDEITKTIGVEYLEFYKSELNCKEKLEKLYSKRKSPLKLDNDFKENYPTLFASYTEQLNMSNSKSFTDVEKVEYVNEISSKYLESYTTINHGIRSVVPKDRWSNDYILQVEETYWKYNTQITIEELLSFLISKENNKYYRLIGLKILGFDYWLFFEQKREELIAKNLLFISKIKINLDNFYSEVTYESEATFISGNVYEKLEKIAQSSYEQNISILFNEQIAQN